MGFENKEELSHTESLMLYGERFIFRSVSLAVRSLPWWCANEEFIDGAVLFAEARELNGTWVRRYVIKQTLWFPGETSFKVRFTKMLTVGWIICIFCGRRKIVPVILTTVKVAANVVFIVRPITSGASPDRGWWLTDISRWVQSIAITDFQSFDVNIGSRSMIILFKRLWSIKMWLTNTEAASTRLRDGTLYTLLMEMQTKVVKAFYLRGIERVFMKKLTDRHPHPLQRTSSWWSFHRRLVLLSLFCSQSSQPNQCFTHPQFC